MNAKFRFYAELNDFLPPSRKQISYSFEFRGHETVKHLLESQGVPHPEVEFILVNGKSVDFSYKVKEGDYISVYPIFESFDISPLIRLREKPLRDPRFVLDNHLGKLTSYLRMLGFDSLYKNNFEDPELANISSIDHRIILTRDRGLLKRSVVTHGYWVREKDPMKQVYEVVRRFDLYNLIAPFRRCMRCNGLLMDVSKKDVFDRLEPKTKRYYDKFKRCEQCEQIYWKGSHFQKMEKFIESIMDQSN